LYELLDELHVEHVQIIHLIPLCKDMQLPDFTFLLPIAILLKPQKQTCSVQGGEIVVAIVMVWEDISVFAKLKDVGGGAHIEHTIFSSEHS